MFGNFIKFVQCVLKVVRVSQDVLVDEHGLRRQLRHVVLLRVKHVLLIFEVIVDVKGVVTAIDLHILTVVSPRFDFYLIKFLKGFRDGDRSLRFVSFHDTCICDCEAAFCGGILGGTQTCGRLAQI